MYDIPKEAMLELLAEESAELAQAALKLSRIIRKENPTPMREDEAVRNLIEEMSDVLYIIDCVINEGHVLKDPDTVYRKINAVKIFKQERWKQRTSNKK